MTMNNLNYMAKHPEKKKTPLKYPKQRDKEGYTTTMSEYVAPIGEVVGMLHVWPQWPTVS